VRQRRDHSAGLQAAIPDVTHHDEGDRRREPGEEPPKEVHPPVDVAEDGDRFVQDHLRTDSDARWALRCPDRPPAPPRPTSWSRPQLCLLGIQSWALRRTPALWPLPDGGVADVLGRGLSRVEEPFRSTRKSGQMLTSRTGADRPSASLLRFNALFTCLFAGSRRAARRPSVASIRRFLAFSRPFLRFSHLPGSLQHRLLTCYNAGEHRDQPATPNLRDPI
jgi:hypothetical protein